MLFMFRNSEEDSDVYESWGIIQSSLKCRDNWMQLIDYDVFRGELMILLFDFYNKDQELVRRMMLLVIIIIYICIYMIFGLFLVLSQFLDFEFII